MNVNMTGELCRPGREQAASIMKQDPRDGWTEKWMLRYHWQQCYGIQDVDVRVDVRVRGPSAPSGTRVIR